ncbi:MAG: hypothetical protein HGA78_00805 [Nitrospirales bacterium]|nr:hypothetical protein [Nitrospirales bacterium]
MREKLEKRLSALKAEFESGQKMLAELEAKEAKLRETMLRISGAIQVLEEELAQVEETEPSPVTSAASAGGTGG